MENRNRRGSGRGKNKGKNNRKHFENNSENLDSNIIIGKNAVFEFLKIGKDIEKIEVEERENYYRLKKEIIDKLKENKNISKEEKEKIEEKIQKVSKNEMQKYGTRHQGIVLTTKEYKYYTFDEVFKNVDIKEEKPLVVILDKIEDPNNLGSILRTSEIFGVSAVVIPKHGSAKVTPTARKVSVGGSEKVPVILTTNLNYFIEDLKEKGFWIYAADMEGAEDIYNLDFNSPVALIFGNEGKGVSRLISQNSDYIFKIPMKGTLDSLNVSVSAGISIYEVQKKRGIV